MARTAQSVVKIEPVYSVDIPTDLKKLSDKTLQTIATQINMELEARGHLVRLVLKGETTAAVRPGKRRPKLLATGKTVDDALAVLKELCQDVQEGGPDISETWPDLHVTYQHAQQILAGTTAVNSRKKGGRG